ncbi:hypothetical protein O3M35_000886 [Rhynocoris fuscipes]|uniref:Uncharacterized protein n=1 Tax=Rhynocoris fuscipes TaxID=488301 RepID=A0AAW1DRK4_9HEMI
MADVPVRAGAEANDQANEESTEEGSEELEKWIIGKPRNDTCFYDVPPEDLPPAEEVQFNLPPMEIDEISTSSGDVTSICSLESDVSFPPYRLTKTEDENLTSYRYQFMSVLIKYLKGGDPAATNCVLTSMLSLDLRIDQYIYALEDSNAIAMLLNIVDIPILSCQISALEVLSRITRIPYLQSLTLNMGFGKTCCKLLWHTQGDVVTFALKVLANLTKTVFGRTSVRKNGVIPLLIMYVDIDRSVLYSKIKRLPLLQQEIAMIALYALRVIRNVSRCRKGRVELFKCGISNILYDLPKCKDFLFVLNSLYIFINCSRTNLYLGEFEFYNVHDIMVSMLDYKSIDIAVLAASYLYRVCDDPKVLDKLLDQNIVNTILNKLRPKLAQTNPRLYDILILILYKFTRRKSVMDKLNEGYIMPTFVALTDVNCDVEPEKAIWEMLADCMAYPSNWIRVPKIEGFMDKILYNLSYHMYEHVKGSVARIVGYICHEQSIFEDLDKKDILLNLWSLLSLQTPYTVAKACEALLPVMKRTFNVGAEIRRISESFYTVKELLMSDDPEVLYGAILLLSKIVQDEDNYIIMGELNGLIRPLELIQTATDPKIRASLCYLIASISIYGKNNFLFGREGNIPLVVNDLKSDNMELKIAAAYALWKISEDPVNCVVLHTKGVTKILLNCLLIDNKDLQVGVGGCLYNIRNLAFDAERMKFLFFNEPLGSDEERNIKKYQERSTYYQIRGPMMEEELPDVIERIPKRKKKKVRTKNLLEMSVEDYSEEEIVVEDTTEDKAKQKDLWAFWGLEYTPTIMGDDIVLPNTCN